MQNGYNTLVWVLLGGLTVCVVLVIALVGFHLSRWAVGQQLAYYCYHTVPGTTLRLQCMPEGLKAHIQAAELEK
jgi:hypothetical protein